ncbi:MAG: hypothetical protein ABIO98_09255 [Chitinophagales bacterium]
MKKLLIFILCSQLLGLSCKKENQCPDGVPATLHYTNCGWAPQVESGEFLTPFNNLSSFDFEFAEGKPVIISYLLRPDIIMICGVGPVAEITCMVETSK